MEKKKKVLVVGIVLLALVATGIFWGASLSVVGAGDTRTPPLDKHHQREATSIPEASPCTLSP